MTDAEQFERFCRKCGSKMSQEDLWQEPYFHSRTGEQMQERHVLYVCPNRWFFSPDHDQMTLNAERTLQIYE